MVLRKKKKKLSSEPAIGSKALVRPLGKTETTYPQLMEMTEDEKRKIYLAMRESALWRPLCLAMEEKVNKYILEEAEREIEK